MMRRACTVLSVVVALAAVLLAAAPGYAERWVRHDAVGDVAVTTADGQSSVDPTIAEGDVVRVAVAHQRRSITVRMKLRAAPPRSGFSAFYALRTPRGSFSIMAIRLPGMRYLDFTDNEVKNLEHAEVRCPAARIRVDRARATIELVVPRHCVGGPRWVRVGAFVGSFDEATETGHGDQATGVDERRFLSPRVRRG